MKLAMATQGDHNTLAKLTVQTIMGFGMEMEQAGELTDKFAHTIQKSLVEWQDLASSVKFAMPFFTATGQSIDQLLGGIEVLSNRALEAGIAGRGLRQALAQFTKHANDNESALAKLGVTIMDTEGNMRDLSDIAMDAKAAFGDVTDLEALTAMLEDMNVRGATAFALLVQNADEYDAAVKNLADSAGEATQMADIQQQSLAMQIQRVKNALLAPFLLADEVGKAEGSLNTFTLRIRELVDEFTQFFIIIGPDGQETYSKHGKAMKEFVIAVLDQAVIVIKKLKDVFLDQEEGFTTMTELVQVATKPMIIMLDILDRLGPSALKWFTYFKLFTALVPINNIRMLMQNVIQTKALMAMTAKVPIQEMTNRQMAIELGLIEGLTLAQIEQNKAKEEELAVDIAENVQTGEGLALKVADTVLTEADTVATVKNTEANVLNAWSVGVMAVKIMAFVGVGYIMIKMLDGLGAALVALAAVSYLGGISAMFRWWSSMMPPPAAVAATAITAATGMAAIWAGYNSFIGKTSKIGGGEAQGLPALKFNKERNYDGGGTYLPTYDNGGMSTEHGMAILQKGESVIPKTQNMLGTGGITLNMGDVYAEDGTDFAEKVAAALPDALRRANDQGAI
jgi:TP901 family phage tail tape measure protein